MFFSFIYTLFCFLSKSFGILLLWDVQLNALLNGWHQVTCDWLIVVSSINRAIAVLSINSINMVIAALKKTICSDNYKLVVAHFSILNYTG